MIVKETLSSTSLTAFEKKYAAYFEADTDETEPQVKEGVVRTTGGRTYQTKGIALDDSEDIDFDDDSDIELDDSEDIDFDDESDDDDTVLDDDELPDEDGSDEPPSDDSDNAADENAAVDNTTEEDEESDIALDNSDDTVDEDGGDETAEETTDDTGNTPPVGEQLHKQNLYHKFMNLHDSVEAYIDKLDNIVPGDKEISKKYKEINDRLKRQSDYLYDYMTIRFIDAPYEASMVFYQKSVVVTGLLIDLLDSVIKESNATKGKPSKK